VFSFLLLLLLSCIVVVCCCCLLCCVVIVVNQEIVDNVWDAINACIKWVAGGVIGKRKFIRVLM